LTVHSIHINLVINVVIDMGLIFNNANQAKINFKRIEIRLWYSIRFNRLL